MKNGISIFYIQFVFNTINMKKSWKCYIWMVPNDEILSWIHQLSIHYYATLVVYRRYSDWKTPVKALIISFLHLVFLINIHYKYEQDKFLLFFLFIVPDNQFSFTKIHLYFNRSIWIWIYTNVDHRFLIPFKGHVKKIYRFF